MLDVKKTLSKILNWSGLKFTWDWSTLNTTDSWVPVLTGNVIQHRVIPSNAGASAVKYGSVWTVGGIYFHRRGNTVFVNGDPQFNATTTRTTVATIPEGFRPVGVAYAYINGTNDYMLFNPSGEVQINARAAGRIWFSSTWVTD